MRLHVAGTTSNDKIQADVGLNFKQIGMHPAFTPTLLEVAGNVTAGNHYYFCTYKSAIGETNTAHSGGGNSYSGGAGTLITTDATHGQVTINVTASTDYRVTNIRIYRSKATGYWSINTFLVAELPNTTQVYTDNIADANLGAQIWPGTNENSTNQLIRLNDTKIMGIGDLNTVIGVLAGYHLQPSGGSNTFIGSQAGCTVYTGTCNVFIGRMAGGSAGSGTAQTGNVGIGFASLAYLKGNYNTAMGYYSGYYLTTGTNNVLLGRYNGANLTTGNENTLVGTWSNAGTSSAYNTQVGNYTGGNNVHNNAIYLGYYAGQYETGNNTLIIDSIKRTTEALSRSSALIYGVTNATPANQILSLGGGGKVGIGTITPNSLLQVNGAIATVIANKTGAYTVTISDSVITGDATAAAFSITLPTAVGITGRQYTFKKIDASANAVTIDGAGTETIDGAATYGLSAQRKYISIVSNGANRIIVANN